MNHYVYVISCPLGLVKLGVATNPKQRVQNLQIGSPVPLELAGHYAMSDRATAQEVVAALQERFRAQRERGHWFRASPLEIRKAIGDREIVALYRTGEAKQRVAARLAAEQAKAKAAELRASATAKERRRRRLQLRRAAAEMLVAGMTQAATADALGISDRTIRNWMQGTAFQSALSRAQARAERQSARAEERAARRREQRDAARRPELRSEQDPEATPDPRRRRAGRAHQSEYAHWLDERDAGRPFTRAELESEADRAAAAAVEAGEGSRR